jgi:hypothetical protein
LSLKPTARSPVAMPQNSPIDPTALRELVLAEVKAK